jgi:hypothetical protein
MIAASARANFLKAGFYPLMVLESPCEPNIARMMPCLRFEQGATWLTIRS